MRRLTKSLSMIAIAVAVFIAPASAHAGSYWWTGAPATGSNGFSWQQTGGWNPWGGGNRCENSATTYGTGSYCQLAWNVPANLDAVSGSIQGSYRQANANFEQQMLVEGNGTTIIQGTTNTQTYNRQWSDMASYLYIRVVNTGAPVSTSAGTVWFDAPSMSINLVDPNNPGLNILEGQSGWKGPSGACIRYGYADAGSGLNSTSLVNVNTGAVYDNPGYQNSAMTTGVFQNDRNCVGVPAPGTGTYTLRAAASDKSGNYVQNDFTVSFDTTAPSVSAPSSGGSPVANGAVFASSTGYRPTFSWSIGDAHSGVAAITTQIDGATVAHSYSGGVVTMTPPARLTLGNRSITIITSDAVGNSTTVSRTITVRDDALPTVAVAAPAASGSNSPLLDVTAADDYSGVDTSTWKVSVNGVQMAVAVGSARVQAEIGRLVNGTHQIEVRVKDLAGNERVHTIAYVASSDSRTPPGIHGIYVIAPPGEVSEADLVRFQAAIVKAGRPQAGTRVELRRGTGTLTSAVVAADGFVDLPLRIDDAGDLTLVAEGTGLAPSTITFRFIPDAAPPTLRIDKPVASGNGSPVLDVTASDTQSGVAPATWEVLVNGVPQAAASSETARLQTSLGRLANGTHQIQVRISDQRGNQHTQTLSYEASGDAYTAPGKTGIYILSSPTITDQGFSYRVTVIAVKNGRPVDGGRFEVLRLGGDETVLAGKLTGPDGYADILITDPLPATMVLRLTGSSLPPVQYSYTYRAAGEPEFCRAHPTHTACQRSTITPIIGGGAGGGSIGGGTGGQGTGGGGSGTKPGGGTPAGGSTGTSGGLNDRVAPVFRLRAIPVKKGFVLRTRRLVFTLRSNERANYTVAPVGSRAGKIGFQKAQTKRVRLIASGPLLKRLRAANGRRIKVIVRVIAIDPNKNVRRTRVVLFVRA